MQHKQQMKVSYSALDLFDKCPQKYKLKEIDKIKEGSSIDAIFGACIHDVLQHFYSQKQSPTLEELLSYFSEKWNERKEKLKDKNIPDMQFQILETEAKNILINFYKDNSDKVPHIISLESKFEVPIEHNGDYHLLTGKIDRIDRLEDGSFEIIDYKTGKKLPSQNSVDEDLQLSLYHLGLTSKWPEFAGRNIKLSLYFLKHREKISTQRNEAHLAKTTEKLISKIEEIKKSKFLPVASSLCDYCGYKNICPMWKHKSTLDDQEIIPAEKNIQPVMAEFLALKDKISQDEKRLDELKDMINNFCDQEGVEQIFGPQNSIMRQTQQRYDYDVDKIKMILEPINKWQEVIDIDTKKLQEIRKSLPPHLRNAIEDSKVLASEFKKMVIKKSK